MFDKSKILKNNKYFLTILKDAVNNDNATQVLELIELKRDKSHEPYTWYDNLSSSSPNNAINRNELIYWYQLLFWIVEAGSLTVCDAIEKLNIYSPGHIYTKLFQRALHTPLPHLIDRLLLHINPGSMLFSGENALVSIFQTCKILTVEHWNVIDKLISDKRALSWYSLLYLLKHKDMSFILNILENCNISLTDPTFLIHVIDWCVEDVEDVEDVKKSVKNELLKFLLQMPNSCLSDEIIEYALSSSSSDMFLEQLCYNGKVEFLKQFTDITCFDIGYLFDLYLYNDKEINKNSTNVLNYMINDDNCIRFFDEERCIGDDNYTKLKEKLIALNTKKMNKK